MTFVYPLGLLGLIGIPVLIVIYVIKNKYTEQTVASTYLWTLSERFIKRRNPLNKLAGIISLILQLIAVALVSLLIAHPIIVIPGSAEEYCFILDASGSMQTEIGGQSRFERGKAEISEIIESAHNGSTFTIVSVGDETHVLCDRLESKESALNVLNGAECALNAPDFSEAEQEAQDRFDKNSSALIYLVTDKNYEQAQNVNVINVSKGEVNYAVGEVEYTYEGASLTVTGKVYAYNTEADVTVEFFVNGGTEAVSFTTAYVGRDDWEQFTFNCLQEDFKWFEVAVKNYDALPYDNKLQVFNVKNENSYETLIVSDTPFFIKSALEEVSNAKVDVITPAEYQEKSGYGLYVFDSFSPAKLPEDGSVWFINPVSSVAGTGFSVQNEVTLESAGKLEVDKSTSSITQKLTAGVTCDEVYVSAYQKCGLYRNFNTLLSYKSNPVIFTGTNQSGNREVVFAFNLHNSNIAVSLDYLRLMGNLLEYSFPEVIEKVTYYCGEKIEINVLSNCDSIKVTSPSGKVTHLGVNSAINEFVLTEVGAYAVTMSIAGTTRTVNLYSQLPIEERNATVAEQQFSLDGNYEEGGLDGKYDTMLALFIVLSVVFAAEWVVYCYERYQLR